MLQEVAAARHVSVLCGNITLNGLVFVKGLQLLSKYRYRYDMLSTLQPENISSLTGELPFILHLMSKQGTTALRWTTTITADDKSTEPSMCLLRLSELLGMFHGHSATDRRDKIYALLGLSTDCASNLDIQVDYAKSWALLFQQVITHILGSCNHIFTWNNEEIAIIRAYGCPIAIVVAGNANEQLELHSVSFSGIPDQDISWTAYCPFPSARATILEGDIVCMLRGSSCLNVIRQCGTHFDIIVIDFPPPKEVVFRDVFSDFQRLPWADFAPSISSFFRDFLLVWDWSVHACNQRQDHEILLKKVYPNESGIHCDSMRFFKTASILEDFKNGHSSIFVQDMMKNLSKMPDTTHERRFLGFTLTQSTSRWRLLQSLSTLFSQLQWCTWFLDNLRTTQPVLDYWRSVGTVSWDLEMILTFAKGLETSKADQFKALSKGILAFMESDMGPIVRDLFPRYDLFASSRHLSASVSLPLIPSDKRFIIHVMFSDKVELLLHAEEAMARVLKTSGLFKTRHNLLAIFAEISVASATPWTLSKPTISKLISCDQNESMWTFLFQELSTDVAMSFHIIKEVHKFAHMYDYQPVQWKAFVQHNMARLASVLLHSDFAKMAVDDWFLKTPHQLPVIQSVCETLNDLIYPIGLIHPLLLTQVWKRNETRSLHDHVNLVRTYLLGILKKDIEGNSFLRTHTHMKLKS